MSTVLRQNPFSDAKTSIQGDLDRSDPGGESGPLGSDHGWNDRPQTHGSHCRAEPLDPGVPDVYSFRDPICEPSGPDVGAERYTYSDGSPMTAFDAVGSFIERRHGESVSAERHGYKNTRHWRRNRQYARGKEMDRQLLSQYENPSTALLSLRISPTVPGRLTMIRSIESALTPVLDKLRYQMHGASHAPFDASEWEYIAVIAGTRKRATPHVHIYVWCDGDVFRERLAPVVEKWVEKCELAPDDGYGNRVYFSDHTQRNLGFTDTGPVVIRGNGEDSVPRMDDAPDESQGATYVLTQIPGLRRVDNMARDELLLASVVDASGLNGFSGSQYNPWVGDGPDANGISRSVDIINN